MIVEDGINDNVYCKNGKYVWATKSQTKAMTDAFDMRPLALEVHRIGLARNKVFVVAPSSHKSRKYNWSRDLIKTPPPNGIASSTWSPCTARRSTRRRTASIPTEGADRTDGGLGRRHDAARLTRPSIADQYQPLPDLNALAEHGVP